MSHTATGWKANENNTSEIKLPTVPTIYWIGQQYSYPLHGNYVSLYNLYYMKNLYNHRFLIIWKYELFHILYHIKMSILHILSLMSCGTVKLVVAKLANSTTFFRSIGRIFIFNWSGMTFWIRNRNIVEFELLQLLCTHTYTCISKDKKNAAGVVMFTLEAQKIPLQVIKFNPHCLLILTSFRNPLYLQVSKKSFYDHGKVSTRP